MKCLLFILALMISYCTAEFIGLNSKAYKSRAIEPLPKAAIRLYMMRFCPWCERVLMYMAKKSLTVDIVNVNLSQKPEWLILRNPEGRVPVIRHMDKFLTDSATICEYLDIMFSNVTILPADDDLMEKEKSMARALEKVVTKAYYGIIESVRDPSTKQEKLKQMHESLRTMEGELKKKPFFAGKFVGHSDYMTYPFMERLWILTHYKKGKTNLAKNGFPGSEQYPKLSIWFGKMRELPEVIAVQQPLSAHLEYYSGYFEGTPNYDAGIL